MRARAPVAQRRFGHVGDEHAMALGDLLQQHAQEGEAVGHGEDVGVAEIELELRIGALGDDVVDVPFEFLENVDQLAEETHRIDRRLDVVAPRLAAHRRAVRHRRIVVERLDRIAVLVAHRDELGLDAGHRPVAQIHRLGELTLEREPRAQVVGRTLPVEIGEHPGGRAVPWADHQTVQIGDRNLVRIGGPQFGHHRDRMDGELRPLAGADRLELADRHRFGLGHAEQIDPARHDVFDTSLDEHRLGLGDALGGGDRRRHGLVIDRAHLGPLLSMSGARPRRAQRTACLSRNWFLYMASPVMTSSRPMSVWSKQCSARKFRKSSSDSQTISTSRSKRPETHRM